jgi:hypothetical protein
MQQKTMAHRRMSGTIQALCVLTALAAVPLIGSIAVADHHESDKGPEVLALKFHADWCGYCQEMGPAFKNLARKHDTAPVLFHVLDHTEESDKRQARYMAHALGLEEVWAERGGSTGFILLVDAETGEVLDELTHDQGFKEMSRALQKAIAEASEKEG